MERGAVSTEALERCTRLFALTAGRNAKFLLSPRKAALSTAKIATRSTDHKEGIR